jgi:hypothetical protein
LAVTLAVMATGFDVSRAVGAGLGDRQRTWDFIAEFAAAWTRPLSPGDGYSEDVLWAVAERLGVRLPAALREAYLLFGRREDLTARQDPLLSPDRLRVDHAGAVIVFRSENQSCAEWGVAATAPWNAEDPPVYVRWRPDSRPWEPFASRMSLACGEMVLSEVLLGAKFMDMCELPGELIGAAESAYRQVTLPEQPLWYDAAVTSRWFAAPGKLLRMDRRGPYCWLIAAGQTGADLESVYTTIPGPWQEARHLTGTD